MADHTGHLYARPAAADYSARILVQVLRTGPGHTAGYETVKRFVRPLRRLHAQAEGTVTRFEKPPT